MSANNFILIKKGHKWWNASERDYETGDKIGYDFNFKTLEDAIRGANKYASEEEIEYGLEIKL